MEWLTLVVLVPAVVMTAVLLFGFTGCFSKPPRPTALPFEPTFTATFTGQGLDQALRGRCLVQRIESSRLSNSGTQVQLTLKALADSILIDRILISQPAATGHPYDSGADLTDVSTAVILVQPNDIHTLPPVDYDLDRTRPLLVAMDISTNSGGLPFEDLPVGQDEALAYFRLGHEAAVADRSPGYSSRRRIYLIERIDVA